MHALRECVCACLWMQKKVNFFQHIQIKACDRIFSQMMNSFEAGEKWCCAKVSTKMNNTHLSCRCRHTYMRIDTRTNKHTSDSIFIHICAFIFTLLSALLSHFLSQSFSLPFFVLLLLILHFFMHGFLVNVFVIFLPNQRARIHTQAHTIIMMMIDAAEHV